MFLFVAENHKPRKKKTCEEIAMKLAQTLQVIVFSVTCYKFYPSLAEFLRWNNPPSSIETVHYHF